MLVVTFHAWMILFFFWLGDQWMIADIFIVVKKYTLYKIHPQEYMPLPPGDEEEKSAEENSEPKFQFSYVECLISTFHQLAKKVNMYTMYV